MRPMDRFTRAIFPGTFDPITNGHLDLIERGARIFDELIVSVLRNPDKNPLFTLDERVQMLREATAAHGNVSVATFDGLLVGHARQSKAQAILRGIRAISDYEYELQMALMNRQLAPEVETVFMMPAQRFTFLSSRLVKEIFLLRGDIHELVPPVVLDRLRAKIPVG